MITGAPPLVVGDLAAYDRDGFAVLPGAFCRSEVAALVATCDDLARTEARAATATAAADGSGSGSGTAWASRLLERVPGLAPRLFSAMHGTVDAAIGRPAELRDARYRSPGPGFGSQKLHTDGVPDDPDQWDLVTVLVALCDFDTTNGAPATVPGSHRWSDERRDARRLAAGRADEVRLVGEAGTAFLLNGLLLHRGARNLSGAPRPSIQVFWGARR